MSEPLADAFFTWLSGIDAGGRAILRRSLAFAPGTWPAAFPYVEPFVQGRSSWQRTVTYLTAGLMALSRAEKAHGNVGQAAANLRVKTDSGSLEARFIALLDADPEQLPHRLRQMITLMAAHDVAPSWAELRRDLGQWNHQDRYIQQRWARAYYAYEPQSPDAPAIDQDAGDRTSEQDPA